MASTRTMDVSQRRQGHWRDNRRLTGLLLLVWAVATVVVVYWPQDWGATAWWGPLGFWLTAQGLLLLYWVLVALYDWRMNAIDRRWGLEDTEAPLD